MKAKKWILAKHFDGWPNDENLKLVEEELPELQTNGIRFGFKVEVFNNKYDLFI